MGTRRRAADIDGESPTEGTIRHRAGSLALIGLAISERGRRVEDHVEVDLSAWLIGHALDAADDAGLLHRDHGRD